MSRSHENITKAIEILEKVDPEISHQRKRAACIRHYKAGDELTPECRALLNERPSEEVAGQTTLGGDMIQPRKRGRPKKLVTYESIFNSFIEEDARLNQLKGNSKYTKMREHREKVGKVIFDMISSGNNSNHSFDDADELKLISHLEYGIKEGSSFFQHSEGVSKYFDYPSLYKNVRGELKTFLMNYEGMKLILSIYPEYGNALKEFLKFALTKGKLTENGFSVDYEQHGTSGVQQSMDDISRIFGFGDYTGLAPGFELILKDLGIRRPDEYRWVETEYNDLDYTAQKFKEFVQTIDPNLLNTTNDEIALYVDDINLRDALMHHDFGRIKFRNGKEVMVFNKNKILKNHAKMGEHLRSVPYRIGYDMPFSKSQEELSDDDLLEGKLVRVADGTAQSKFDIQIVGNSYRERKCAQIISSIFIANLPEIFNGWEGNIAIGNYQSLNDSGKSIGSSTLGSYSPHYDTLTVNTSIISDMDIFVAPKEELQSWEMEKVRKAHSHIVATMFHEFAHQLDARMGNMKGKFYEKPIYTNDALQAVINKCKEAGVKNDPVWQNLSATRNYPAQESWRKDNGQDDWGQEFFSTTMESYLKNPHEFLTHPTLQQLYKEIRNALGGWESPYLTKKEKMILHQKMGMIQ